MATLNIKDPEVHHLARELAQLRHTSATGAVREALREALERDRRESRAGRAAALLAIGRRSADRPEPFMSEDDIYDEFGVPR